MCMTIPSFIPNYKGCRCCEGCPLEIGSINTLSSIVKELKRRQAHSILWITALAPKVMCTALEHSAALLLAPARDPVARQ